MSRAPQRSLAYVALNGSLGTGFKESSLRKGVELPLAFIGVDSGSTDAGPYYLGTGEWIWATEAYERDLRLGLLAARKAGVPFIVGSCGGAGLDSSVDGFASLVDQIARQYGLRLRVGSVKCELDRALAVEKLRHGSICPLPGAPDLTEATLQAPGHIVAMAGAEPIQEALDGGADVVLVGRCADAAIYAAIPLMQGFDAGLVWNAAKIVECGSAMAENRKGQDSVRCEIDDDGFVLEALDPELRCTVTSVTAHTMYETADPYRLVMPSGTLDARSAEYESVDDRRVRVRGGTFTPATAYTTKLEGATPVGYLSTFWGSIRDPFILAQLASWTESLEAHIDARLQATWGAAYALDIKVYGAPGGAVEPTPTPGEAVVVFDLMADTQEAATGMARAAYHVALHWPIPQWRAGSITTFAHPYSAPVVDRGPVFRFTLNHQMILEDDERQQVFRLSMSDLGRR